MWCTLPCLTFHLFWVPFFCFSEVMMGQFHPDKQISKQGFELNFRLMPLNEANSLITKNLTLVGAIPSPSTCINTYIDLFLFFLLYYYKDQFLLA